MKNLSNKQKIVFILSLVFFCTSVAVKIRNFNITRMSMNKEKALMEQKNIPNVNSNENIQNKEEVKNRIADLWSTLNEATSYLKNNICNKDKREEVSDLIDDCISALNSIENASTKIKDKNAVDATKDIKKIKEDFKELKKAYTEYNLDRCKKILNSKESLFKKQ